MRVIVGKKERERGLQSEQERDLFIQQERIIESTREREREREKEYRGREL